MAAGSLASINIRFFADLKQFSTAMQNSQRQLTKMGKKMQSVGKGLSIGVTLPILALGVASIKAASDAEETSSKFNVVFSKISKSAQDSANVLRNSYGLSSEASKKLLSDTGDLLTGFGFSQKSALDLSTEVNKLAVDLASFTNFSGGAAGASAALTKALLGERESVKSLGISILEEDVKARVSLNTKKGLVFETNRQAKAYATLQIAQEQSKNAIGDYERTNKSFANQMRLVQERVSDLSVEFGKILLPYALKLAQYIGKLTTKFSNLSETTKKIIVVIAGLAAAIGPLLVVLGFMMTTVIPGLITAYGGLSTAVVWTAGAFKTLTAAMAANPIALVALGIGLLVERFTALIQKITPAVSKLKTFFNLIKSGGNHAIFVNLQMADQVAAMVEQQKAADASAKATAEFNKRQKEAADLAKKLNTELNKKPGGNGNATRKKATNVDASIVGISNPLQDLTENIKNSLDLVVPLLDGMESKLIDFSEASSVILTGVANNFAIGFGEIIGGIMSGKAAMGDVFGLLLNTIGDLATQLGKAAISIGIGMIAIKAAFSNPFTAIAAGIALVAMGALIKGIAGKFSGGDSSQTSFANGGIVYGPTNALIGEYAGAVNNPEVVAPLDKLKSLLGTSNSDIMEITGKFEVTGDKMQLVLDRYAKRKNRTT